MIMLFATPLGEERCSGAYRSRIALANLYFVVKVILCLTLLGGLAYADDGADRTDSTMSADSEPLKRKQLFLKLHLSEARGKRPRGWCVSRLFDDPNYFDYPDYAKARRDRRLGRTWADQILANRNLLQDTYEDEEVILSSEEQVKVLRFMSGLARSVRKWTADLLVGTEGNPKSLFVFRAIAQNLERAPSWPSDIRNTVMCYLDVFNDYMLKDEVFGAFNAGYQRCELPPGRRGDVASLIKRKREIVKQYCGGDVPFPASPAQE